MKQKMKMQFLDGQVLGIKVTKTLPYPKCKNTKMKHSFPRFNERNL